MTEVPGSVIHIVSEIQASQSRLENYTATRDTYQDRVEEETETFNSLLHSLHEVAADLADSLGYDLIPRPSED
jgi:hypothetical protein